MEGAFSVVTEIRADFPVLRRVVDGRGLVYLDSAATSLKPRSVIDAVVDYYERYTANIHRGKHRLSEEASDRFEDARIRVAMFLRCRPSEIVFTQNTTASLNLVAHGLRLQKTDVVVSMLDAHHSMSLPWRDVATVECIKTCEDGALDLVHYNLLLDQNPAVVVLTGCSNVTGEYYPVEQMTKMAKARGVTVVLDLAQSVAHRRPDLRTLDADFVAFSSHKMLGPSGIGVLFGRSEALEALSPQSIGGGTVDFVSRDAVKLRRLPQRLEPGTPAIEAAVGFGAAIEYLDNVGFSDVAWHDTEMSRHLLAAASTRNYLEVIGPRRAMDRAGILTVSIPGIADVGAVARALSDGYGIMIRTGHLCSQPLIDSLTSSEVYRLSTYIYNTAEEIYSAFEALDDIVAKLGSSGR